MISVPLPTSLTDTTVDRHVDLADELQSEGVGRGERMTPLTPGAVPSLTALYGALQSRHCCKGEKGGPILSAEVEGEKENR